VHPGRRQRIADEVAIGDVREVDTAGGGEAVPLPEPGVDLEQLVAPVARVAHHLDLRDAVETERTQEGEPLLDDLLHPYRLADPGAAHVAARLAQLAAREEPERSPVAVEVAAERVHLLRGAGNELLHHRLVRRGGFVGALELGRRLAAEELAPMAAPEADVRRRL